MNNDSTRTWRQIRQLMTARIMEWIIGIIIVVLIIAVFSGSAKCDICNLPIKKKSYTYKIGGKKQTLCPKCNSQMEHKISKEAFKKRFG